MKIGIFLSMVEKENTHSNHYVHSTTALCDKKNVDKTTFKHIKHLATTPNYIKTVIGGNFYGDSHFDVSQWKCKWKWNSLSMVE